MKSFPPSNINILFIVFYLAHILNTVSNFIQHSLHVFGHMYPIWITFPSSVVHASLLSKYACMLRLSSSPMAKRASTNSCLSIPRTFTRLNSVKSSFCISRILSLLCSCSMARGLSVIPVMLPQCL